MSYSPELKKALSDVEAAFMDAWVALEDMVTKKWTELEHMIAVSQFADRRAVFATKFGADADDNDTFFGAQQYWCLIEQCLAYDLGLAWDAKPCESLGAFQGRVALLMGVADTITLKKLGVPYDERVVLMQDNGEYWYAIEAALARLWGLK